MDTTYHVILITIRKGQQIRAVDASDERVVPCQEIDLGCTAGRTTAHYEVVSGQSEGTTIWRENLRPKAAKVNR